MTTKIEVELSLIIFVLTVENQLIFYQPAALSYIIVFKFIHADLNSLQR